MANYLIFRCRFTKGGVGASTGDTPTAVVYAQKKTDPSDQTVFINGTNMLPLSIGRGWYYTKDAGDLTLYDYFGVGITTDTTMDFLEVPLEQSSLVATDSDGNAYTVPPIRQATALNGFTFLMTDSTDNQPITGQAGNIVVRRSIDGAAFAFGTLGAVSEVGNGIYKVNFGGGDLNGRIIMFQATGTGMNPYWEKIITSTALP